MGGKSVPRAPVMYLCVRGIDFASYYFFSYHTTTRPKDFSIGLGSCFHSVLFFSHHTIATIQPKDCPIFLLHFGVVFQYDIFFFHFITQQLDISTIV